MYAETKTRNSQTEKEGTSSDIDHIIKTRYHGAANIRGIRYQILYSILRAFDLKVDGQTGGSIRLEGIEDLDLLGMHLEDKLPHARQWIT